MRTCVRLLVLLSAFMWLPATAVEPRDHVRVVLDLSKSMLKNDPGRLAILATLLLHDLARPNSTLGDSFKIIPFHANWEWDQPGKPPPTQNGPSITAEYGRRQPFVDAVKKLPYNANWTHFYPGLNAAIKELQNTPGGRADTRTIVLVTDGVPDDRSGTKDREAQLIQQELLPLLEQHSIRLYVLAFSDAAYRNKQFFDLMTRSDTLGKVFIDPRGDHLLDNMLDLFAASLGYQVDPAQLLTPIPPLDLEHGGKPQEVAVVVLAKPKPATWPTLGLTAPAAGSVNNPGGLQSADEVGASYTLTWVLSPDAGNYTLRTDVRQGSAAVLRPLQVQIKIQPQPPNTQTKRTLAKIPLPLQVLVTSEYGGDPGSVDVNYRLRGPRWQEDRKAPMQGRTPTGAGVVHTMPVVFRENQPPHQKYPAYIDVEVRRGAKILGALSGDQAHAVEVYPFLALAPFPSRVDAAGQALHAGDRACASFQLQLKGGYLPDPAPYPLRVTVHPGDAKVIDREFNKAGFTLDGSPLRFAARPGLQPGEWYTGRRLSVEQLLEHPHELCIKVGKPKAGDPVRPVELPVHFSLLVSPYDEFPVIEPLTLRVRLAEPPLPWVQWSLLIGLALLALALLWYLRRRPVLAPDLGYAIGPEGGARLLSRPLGAGSWPVRLFGLRVEKPLSAEGDDRPLAWVRPVDEELYRLRPAGGIRLTTADSGEPVPLERGLATIAVHRLYRLATADGAHWMRLEYR